MAIRYVEFTRQIIFRPTKDGDGLSLVIGGKAVVGDSSASLSDQDWHMETTGSYLLCVHRKTRQQFRIPSCHIMTICDGKADESSAKPGPQANSGAGKR